MARRTTRVLIPGASLNRHVHFDENHPGCRTSRALLGAQIRSRRVGHCCVIDGVFEPAEEVIDAGPQAVRFRAAADLTPEAVAAITEQVRIRVLRWFAHSGVLAPNAPLRAAAVAFGREVADAIGAPTEVSAPPRVPASNARWPARYLWAMLLARLFESLPLVCPNCGADMRLIAFITEAAPVERILLALGEPPRPPPIMPARATPAWDEAPEPASDWDLVAQPEPELEFDQRIAWSSPSPAGGGAGRLPLAAVRHDTEPAPARRFGLQRASREVAPPCFRALTSHPECRYRPASAPG